MAEKRHDANERTQHIAFDIASDHAPLVYQCLLKVDSPSDAQNYELRRIRVTVVKAAPQRQVMLKMDEDLCCAAPDALAGKMVDLPCPACDGAGERIAYAFPQAESEAGLSGYALFSCVRLTGVEACTLCGGSGASYRKEQPALRASATALVKGSGRVRVQRLPCKGMLPASEPFP